PVMTAVCPCTSKSVCWFGISYSAHCYDSSKCSFRYTTLSRSRAKKAAPRTKRNAQTLTLALAEVFPALVALRSTPSCSHACPHVLKAQRTRQHHTTEFHAYPVNRSSGYWLA